MSLLLRFLPSSPATVDNIDQSQLITGTSPGDKIQGGSLPISRHDSFFQRRRFPEKKSVVVVLWWWWDNITTTSAERAEPGCASRQIRWGGRPVRTKARPLPGSGLLSHLSSCSQTRRGQIFLSRPGGRSCCSRFVFNFHCLLATRGGLFTAECGVSPGARVPGT